MLTKPQASVLLHARKQDTVNKGVYPNDQGVRSRAGGARHRMIAMLVVDGYVEPKWPQRITDAGRGVLADFESRFWNDGHGNWHARAKHEC